MTEKNRPDLWAGQFPRPKEDGNKHDRGHAVIYGGPMHSAGATKIAARCALRCGAGLVSIACDQDALPVYAASFEAVMTKLTKSAEEFSQLIQGDRVKSVLVGPGAGVTQQTKEIVLSALKHRKSCILDADALSVFSDNPQSLFDAIQSSCILTPHQGEFERLFGKLIHSDDQLLRAKQAASLSHALVIYKGFNTIIATPDGRSTINTNATPYLATAGTGDALAGICAGLLAQGMPAFEAACAAVWLHAEVASHFGPGLIAEDIADGLPAVLKAILA